MNRAQPSSETERGDVSLVELVVASLLAMALIAMVGTLGYQIERFLTQQNAGFVAETGAMRNLSISLDNLSLGSQSGLCVSPAAGTPLSQCTHVSATGPVIEAATPSGFCFYVYPSATAGLVAPSLDCVAAFTSGSGSGQSIYAFDYAPSSGATYTNCSLGSGCFGNNAPAPGSLPSSPAACATSCNAKLVGSIDGTTPPFSFSSTSGPVSASGTLTPAQLASIQTVTIAAPVQVGTFGHSRQIQYTHSASVSGNAYAQEESWAAIA